MPAFRTARSDMINVCRYSAIDTKGGFVPSVNALTALYVSALTRHPTNLLSICNYGMDGKPLENLELPVGKAGICFGMDGKSLEMLELPVGIAGICFGMDGIPLETLELPVGKLTYVLELVENHWKTWY